MPRQEQTCPKPPFARQEQPWPGRASKMHSDIGRAVADVSGNDVYALFPAGGSTGGGTGP